MSPIRFSRRQRLLFDGSCPSWETLPSEEKHQVIEQLAQLFMDYIGGLDLATNDSPQCEKGERDAQEDNPGAS